MKLVPLPVLAAAALLLVATAHAQDKPKSACVIDIQRNCTQDDIAAGEAAVKACINKYWMQFSAECRYELWIQTNPQMRPFNAVPGRPI